VNEKIEAAKLAGRIQQSETELGKLTQATAFFDAGRKVGYEQGRLETLREWQVSLMAPPPEEKKPKSGKKGVDSPEKAGDADAMNAEPQEVTS
jgi:hypothetical protein